MLRIRPTVNELRVLAALIDRHVAMNPKRRYMGSPAAIIAIHVQLSTATVRRALKRWALFGIVVERGHQGCWPTQWVIPEHNMRRHHR